MPIASTLAYIKDLLDNLPMPSYAPNLRCYITPPDPNVEAENPTAYAWPTDGDESRNPEKGGTIPRSTGVGTPSGTKPLVHAIDLYIVWNENDDDPEADSLFPGVVDAVMDTLRRSANPVVIADPYTQFQTQLIDVGEDQRYRIAISALENQAYNRLDALLQLSVLELMQA